MWVPSTLGARLNITVPPARVNVFWPGSTKVPLTVNDFPGDKLGVAVGKGVGVAPGVAVAAGVGVAAWVGSGTAVRVGVGIGVAVGVARSVRVGVGVGTRMTGPGVLTGVAPSFTVGLGVGLGVRPRTVGAAGGWVSIAGGVGVGVAVAIDVVTVAEPAQASVPRKTSKAAIATAMIVSVITRRLTRPSIRQR